MDDMITIFADMEANAIEEIAIEDLLSVRTGDGHSFELEEDESLQALIDDISTNGFLEPILVRADKDGLGCYEIISGHRRVYAAEKLGFERITAIVMNDDNENSISYYSRCDLTEI
ncbi:ParB N-terminal domain-containing protein [Emergencia sp. 1XD21-10]|uniref:ParB N-terminal domain-containing protein n=1 Tax=Emergencia sp. 1XD21-10 TaxID=2304569 RepID=UPI001FAE172A|nr:ParB N-terminal domain-containing protein [Emergencia sp. 1XD21-10]